MGAEVNPMAMVQTDKDALLTQFLGMTEDTVHPDVAISLLEACNWDLQAVFEQLFSDLSNPPPPQRAPESRPAAPVRRVEDIIQQAMANAGASASMRAEVED